MKQNKKTINHVTELRCSYSKHDVFLSCLAYETTTAGV